MPFEVAELVQDAEGRFGRNGRGPLPNELRAGQPGHRQCQLPFALDAQQAVTFHSQVLAEATTIEAASRAIRFFHHRSSKLSTIGYAAIVNPKNHVPITSTAPIFPLRGIFLLVQVTDPTAMSRQENRTQTETMTQDR
jgi:hypothetical protein